MDDYFFSILFLIFPAVAGQAVYFLAGNNKLQLSNN